jgi:lipoprotein-anchoring transpeptidase ErfK/SrfK
MAKPIYAGSYSNRGRGRWKRVFIIIVLVQIALVTVYLIAKRGDDQNPEPEASPSPEVPAPADLATPATLPEPSAPVAAAAAATPETRAALDDARAAIAGGQLMQAKEILDRLVVTSPSDEAIQLLGDVNIRLLRSPLMMPGKEYYVIQSGDYLYNLYKIAKTFNTTVELIKGMNGLETDNIRAGARLLVFNGALSIRVSKQYNHLDLMLDGKLFKRYPVGTGEFGKTPAVSFTIVDKIVEPPWTRPADNRKIEYGDPENVLGTRWMALTSEEHPELTGFGIHGTWERDSIGKQSSAGCVRMLNEDVEELFDLVPRKTTVIITD